MFREVLKSKLHRLTITDASIDYEGSITLDAGLMQAADLVEYEKVLVADVNNGQRFETYVIKGAPGSGTVCVNGAAAKLVNVGDLIIVMSFCSLSEEELFNFKPRVVYVDAQNRQVSKKVQR